MKTSTIIWIVIGIIILAGIIYTLNIQSPEDDRTTPEGQNKERDITNDNNLFDEIDETISYIE